MSRQSSSSNNWLANYGKWFKAWARSNSRPQDAEDAAQEVAANMLADGVDAVRHPQAYLQRGASNRLITEVQRESRRDEVSLEELADSEHPVFNDPDAAIRAQQLAKALEAALAQLPLKQRQAFIYHRLEGYTQPEIAAKMGIALNTVERYIMNATRHVREELQDFCPD